MKQLQKWWCVFLLVLLAGFPVLAAEPPGRAKPDPKHDPLQGLDGYVTDVMKEWHVPGLALAVVKDGKVVLARGYGYRDREKKLPVTSRTLFAIGSITKSFTVAGLGMLADEKKFDWDRSVREYLPDFRLHDDTATSHVTGRDLVTHRTGLPRHDTLWYLTDLKRRQLYDRLRYLEPSKELRYTYQYNNLMFLTAGVVLERISGGTWEEFIRRRLFQPLGMSRSNFSVTDMEKDDDFARPYAEEDGKVRRIPLRNIDAMAPAGAINSCVEDMSRYLLFHIDGGRYGGKRLLSRRNVEEMTAPQMVIPLFLQKRNFFQEPGDSTYGLGFVVSRHRGHKMIMHGGAIDGYIAFLGFLPDKKMGVVALSNVECRDINPVPPMVGYEALDRLLGETGGDWREKGRRTCKKYVETREKEKKESIKDRRTGTSPTHPLSDLAGTYEHPAYGKVAVEVDGKGLRLVFSGATVLARHYHYDTFQFIDTHEHPAAMLEDEKLTFEYGDKGAIDRFRVRLQAGVGDFTFKRIEKKKRK